MLQHTYKVVRKFSMKRSKSGNVLSRDGFKIWKSKNQRMAYIEKYGEFLSMYRENDRYIDYSSVDDNIEQSGLTLRLLERGYIKYIKSGPIEFAQADKDHRVYKFNKKVKHEAR